MDLQQDPGESSGLPQIKIVISYRRQDTPGGAGRLRQDLGDRFGRENVFIDIDTIPPGVDWLEEIERTVSSADVVLPVIGLHWLTSTDEDGRPRLEDPNDVLRLEIETALARRDVRVIPVQLHGALIPSTEELPASLAGLTRRQSVRIDDEDWDHDVQKLVRALEHIRREKAGMLGAADVDRELGPLLERSAADDAGWPEGPSERGGQDADAEEESTPTSLGVGGAALLTLGIFVPWNDGRSFAGASFGPNTADHSGLVVSLAPSAIAVGALAAALLARFERRRSVAIGLLLGFAVGGAAKYVGVLWATLDREANRTFVAIAGTLVVLTGVALIALAAARGLRGVRPSQAGRPAGGAERQIFALVVGLVGAALMVVGTVIPFNSGAAFGGADQTLIELSGRPWEAFELLVLAASAAVGAVALRSRWSGVASGVLIALGIAGVMLWLRYVLIPVLQPSQDAQAGGYVGLAGAGLILVSGILAERTRTEPDRARASRVVLAERSRP